jgi:hypothetical protein
VAAEGENLSHKQIHKQNPAIESTPNFEIGTICLSLETNAKYLAESLSIVSGSKSLEKYVYLKEVACFDSNLPAFLKYSGGSSNLTHVPSVDFVTREFSFMHESSMFYDGMRSLKKDLVNQIDYAVIELKRTLKQEFELLLNHGRLFYTKRGLFGINISSSYQFG